MKKSILTLGLLVSLFLVEAGASRQWEHCTNFTLTCANGSEHIGLVCGDTTLEMYGQMLEWEKILCN